MSKQEFIKALIETVKANQELDRDQLNKIKVKLCKKYNEKNIPTNIEILTYAKEEDFPKLKILQAKPTRSISGVTPIAIMSKPQECPHGACTMCPSMTKKKVPQSYTGK